ncbi:NF-kappa-B inhibitor cactus-like [Nylanderia fulva]|uniref:NF-kappa-B inhibitor cactus-like n=1 Tax=Nylanderia fulva TaxID=613905 RepID=UPI0010FB5238|nr:NF-kappa-B inhibitor cactus-like [Nylanderia fulva]XP_029175864.1 NF-kappa-B inhibitor cactus-like [Nylanderia fulva]XP_029175865.1 NF-kappa-B inhibitor cactus-like [Nylanderia fulva]XP_029175866.1 NF-kappa-B inhibitor cactus-like [Nylanderia fulva]
MWYSPSKIARIEEREDDGRKQRDDSGLATTSNDDSGFLSVGNVQFSGEIPGQTRGCLQQEVAPMMPEAATTSSSSMATKESIRTSDSGVVDVELSDDLDRLTLSGRLIQSESKTLELSHVDARVIDGEQRRQGDVDDDQCLTINKDLWQFYSKDGDGDTQLHIAIMQGYVQAALILISLAPHPRLLNIMNDHLQSPLHLAVLTQQPVIVRRLVLAGADLSLRNFRGNTALHLACASGDLACAKALTDPLYPMERNKLIPEQKVPALPQNLEQINYNGEMCLHVAVINGHVNLVRLLLRLGADLEAKECLAGRTALHLAIERKCWAIITFLLKECEPCLDTKTYSGLTAYQLALYTDRQLARELLRHGAKAEPLPDSDSESSDDEPNYVSTTNILQLKNVQILKV